jgi:hypothetical protein
VPHEACCALFGLGPVCALRLFQLNQADHEAPFLVYCWRAAPVLKLSQSLLLLTAVQWSAVCPFRHVGACKHSRCIRGGGSTCMYVSCRSACGKDCVCRTLVTRLCGESHFVLPQRCVRQGKGRAAFDAAVLVCRQTGTLSVLPRTCIRDAGIPGYVRTLCRASHFHCRHMVALMCTPICSTCGPHIRRV